MLILVLTFLFIKIIALTNSTFEISKVLQILTYVKPSILKGLIRLTIIQV